MWYQAANSQLTAPGLSCACGMGLWGPGQEQRDPHWAEAEKGVGAAHQERPAEPTWTLRNGWWHTVLGQWIWRLQGLGVSHHAASLSWGCGTASPGVRFDANAARRELLCPRACWLLPLLSLGSWLRPVWGQLSLWGPRDVFVHVKQLPAHWQQAGVGIHTKRTSSSGIGAE